MSVRKCLDLEISLIWMPLSQDPTAPDIEIVQLPADIVESEPNPKKRRKQSKNGEGSTRLSFAARTEIIAIVESKQNKLTRKQIAQKYGISTARVCQILKDKERRRVSEELSKGICPQRKRVCLPKYDSLEQRLLQWIKAAIAMSSIPGYPPIRNPLGMSTICTQARIIAVELGVKNFTASNGWFTRFKDRYGLSELAQLSKDMMHSNTSAVTAAAAAMHLQHQQQQQQPLQQQQQDTSTSSSTSPLNIFQIGRASCRDRVL